MPSFSAFSEWCNQLRPLHDNEVVPPVTSSFPYRHLNDLENYFDYHGCLERAQVFRQPGSEAAAKEWARTLTQLEQFNLFEDTSEQFFLGHRVILNDSGVSAEIVYLD